MNRCIDWKNKGFSFMRNTDCEYFPCHDNGTGNTDDFNCLFCFCPLYEHDNCGGEFTVLKDGCKDCSACVLPHKKENYGRIIERLHCPVTQGETFASKGEKNAV